MQDGRLPEEVEFEVSEGGIERLDVYLAAEFSAYCQEHPSRSQISKWIKAGCVRLNDVVVLQPAAKTTAGDVVSVSVPARKVEQLTGRSGVPFEICYEDEALLVVNKPPGLSMHPGAGDTDEPTLAHGLLDKVGESLLDVGHPLRPGIVHRLDKDTSGLVVIAKSLRGYQHLTQQFLPPRTVHRKYTALCELRPAEGSGRRAEEGRIEMAIRRHPVQRKIMQAVESGGRPAVTHWRVLNELVHGVELELTLETGRTHQIRVHLKSALAPIVGDRVYGYRVKSKHSEVRRMLERCSRQMLHACQLEFVHPLSNEKLHFDAAPPADYQEIRGVLNDTRTEAEK